LPWRSYNIFLFKISETAEIYTCFAGLTKLLNEEKAIEHSVEDISSDDTEESSSDEYLVRIM